MNSKFMRRVSEREQAINSAICYRNKQIDVSFLCVCPVIDHEFCHHIVKVAADPRGDSLLDLQTTFIGNVMTKFMINNRTEALKTDINLFFYEKKLSNCRLSLADVSHEFYIHVSVHILTIKISQ